MKIGLPEIATQTINEYKNLKLGGKEIPCPYFINSEKEKGGLRVLVGKGSPEEIEHEVKVWAQLRGFDLEQATVDEIREFMIKHKIGVDCSGFLVHVINRWMKKRMGKRLIDCLKFENNSLFSILKRRLRSAENIGASTLTSEMNTTKITDLNEVRPGDLIRLKGIRKNAHHIAMVSEMEGDFSGEKFIIKSFKYVHSTRNYADKHGLREGEVKITKPGKELKDQEWTEIYKGKSWTYEGLMKEYEDNGMRRLKCFEKEIQRNFEENIIANKAEEA